MRANTKFPVAVHILTFVAVLGEKYSTSENIAKSVNTNPVVIRRINALLKRANLISVTQGVRGIRLNRPPAEISLLDVYRAVASDTNDLVFDLGHSPNQSCMIGANIQAALSGPLRQAQNEMERTLGEFTLADIVAAIPGRRQQP